MVDKAKRKPFAIYFDEPTKTVQASKDECDINCIIARASNFADISHVNRRVAQYGDFSNVPSYMDALGLVNRANGMFMSLDAKIRERFSNDPSRMIAFLQDVSNYDEAVKLGLVVPKAIDPAAAAAGSDKGAKATASDKAPKGAS